VTARRYTEAERAQAKPLYIEHGPTRAVELLAEAGLDVLPDTISRWANRYGWTTDRESHARNATAASGLSYEQRRAALVERAGDAAAEFLERALRVKGARDSRNFVEAFAKAIDKAELLSGRATSRSEVASVDAARERIRAVRDELAERRTARGSA
jgi:hypothetical protein